MELGQYGVDYLRPNDEFEFLESLSYAKDAWFAIQRPLNLETAFRSSHFSKPHQQASSQAVVQNKPVAPSAQLRFAPIAHPEIQTAIPTFPPAMAMQKRSGSTSSTVTSPELRKAKPLPRPISPKSTERRRLRTYSTDDEEDDSSENESESSSGNTKSNASRKRAKPSVTASHTSAFRGVSCCGKDRKFQARIRDGSKVHYLGRFDNEFDAAIKYDEAARSHKGDAAVPNFVAMTPEETLALREHYFANGHHVLPEFHRFLYQGTLERLELKLGAKRKTNRSNE